MTEHPEAPTPPTPVVHLDAAARAAVGKAARAAVPRSVHAQWVAPASRPDPVALLQGQETTRVPELLAIRHDRMMASPFAFYRGAAVIMAADLASQPNTGLRVQACGDAHLANFGGYSTPDRALVFDMNDFDETNRGPFEWDVKRLATSFELAARSTNVDDKRTRSIVRHSVASYRTAMTEFASMSNIDVWYTRLDVAGVLERWRGQISPAERERFNASVTKAQGKNSLKAFSKLTEFVDGEHRIVSDPPLVVPAREVDPTRTADELVNWLRDRFRKYRRSLQADRRHLLETYRIVDAARKVVGVGSVGTRTWIVLLLGRDDQDPLFLQIKEADQSVLEPYSGTSGYATHGQRVVEGQRLLQATSDTLLGWSRSPGLDGVDRDFYVRQLWDGKLSPDFETMTPEVLRIFGEMCGWTLARGHAKSGDRIAISAYLGTSDTFDRSIADFAHDYADQNQRDFDAAAAAVQAGRLVTSAAPEGGTP